MIDPRATLCLVLIATACQQPARQPALSDADVEMASALSDAGVTLASGLSDADVMLASGLSDADVTLASEAGDDGGMVRTPHPRDVASEVQALSQGTYRALSCRFPGDDELWELVVSEDGAGNTQLSLEVLCPQDACYSLQIEGSESEYEVFRDVLALNRSGSSDYTIEVAVVAARPSQGGIEAQVRVGIESHYGDVFRRGEPSSPCTTVFREDTSAPTVEDPPTYTQTDPITLYFTEDVQLDPASIALEGMDAFSVAYPTSGTTWTRSIELRPNFLWTPGSHILSLGDVRDVVGNVATGMQINVVVGPATHGTDNPSFEQDDTKNAWSNCTRAVRAPDDPGGDGEWLGLCGSGAVLIDVPEGAQTMLLEAGLGPLHYGTMGRIIVTSRAGVVATWTVWPPGDDAADDVYHVFSPYSAPVRAEDGPYKLRIVCPAWSDPLFGNEYEEMYLDALRFE